MEQEGAFMSHLANVSSYRTEGDRLVLTDAEGNDLLFFVQAEEVQPAPLAGTEWTLESFSSPGGETVSSVIAGTTITAVFSDGNVGGNAGCNSYGAGYRIDGAELSIEPPISTKMYCGEPEGVMEQENRYLNLLESVAGYRIDGNRLDLLDEGGATLLSYSAGRA
jgi:heat shock protein HslJ